MYICFYIGSYEPPSFSIIIFSLFIYLFFVLNSKYSKYSEFQVPYSVIPAFPSYQRVF